MKNWFEKRKPAMIVLGVAFVLLALFFVPSFSRVEYEASLSGDSTFSGETNIQVFGKVVSDVGTNLSVAFSKNFNGYLTTLKYFSIFYLAATIIILIKMDSKGEYESIEHGSADWCTQREAYNVLNPKNGMILADGYCMPMNPPPAGKNGNILVIGGSGAGKSASFVIPNAFQMLGSYIFTDPKGELYDRTAGIFKARGYDVHVINLVDPRVSDGYNPLSHIRGTLDVDTIAKIISNKEGGDKKSSDPFWDQTSEALLKAVMYYIILNRPEEERSLASCLALVRLGGENDGEDLRNIFMDLPFDNPARKAFETIRLGSEKTFSNILVSLAAKLEAFDSQEIAAMTSTNTIEFEDLVNKKSVLYFITPATNDTYNFLMNIFFSQMLDRLYDYADTMGGKLPTPLFLILDEFANIGRIPRFEQILSTCRSYRINISIILQSIDQLIAIYDEKVTENIMANCSTHLFLGSNAQKTLETFSKQLGEKTITRDNVSRSTDKESNFSGRNYSDQIMARALMTPDELRRMSSEECIILVQATKPIKAQKYWYYRKPGGPHPLSAEAKKLELDHRNIEEPKRGKYKITNPYELNGYDDIFGSSSNSNKTSNSTTTSSPFEGLKTVQNSNFVDDIDIDTSRLVKAKNEAPAVTTAQNTTMNDDYDLQAELEKKFDELFGPKAKKNSNVVN